MRKEKKVINVLTVFFIFYKSDVKTFLKQIVNQGRNLDIVPYILFLRYSFEIASIHLKKKKKKNEQTALISFFSLFPLPLVQVFFLSTSQKLQFKRKLRNHRCRWFDTLGDVRANETLACEAFNKPPNQKRKPPMRETHHPVLMPVTTEWPMASHC